MRSGFAFSICLHLMALTIGYFGLPSLRRDIMMEVPVMIEIVDVSDITNAAQPEKKTKKQVKKDKPKPPPEPPKKKQHVAKAPPPEPKPEPKPEPEVAAVPPPPEQKPKAKEKPKPKPEPKPEVKKKAPQVLADAKPKKKPKKKKKKQVDAFASVLKTVEKLKKQAPKVDKPPEKKKKPEDSFKADIARALASTARSYDSSRPVTISEIDLVRQQIAKCWNLPAGAKDAANMVIEIDVSMNSDGTVRTAKIVNQGLQTDPFLRAMAESALRATLNRRCQPFRLPADKYDRWKAMKLVFNPKDMF